MKVILTYTTLSTHFLFVPAPGTYLAEKNCNVGL